MRIKLPNGIGINFRVGKLAAGGITWITETQQNLITAWGLRQLDRMWTCDATNNALLGTGDTANRRTVSITLPDLPSATDETIAECTQAFTNDDVTFNRVISFGDGSYATIKRWTDDPGNTTEVIITMPPGTFDDQSMVAEILYVEQDTLITPSMISSTVDASPTSNGSIQFFDEETEILRVEDTRSIIFDPVIADIMFKEIGWAPVDNGLTSKVFGRKVIDLPFMAGDQPYIQITLIREVECSELSYPTVPIANYTGSGISKLFVDQFDENYRSSIGTLGNTNPPVLQNALMEIAGAMSRGFTCYGKGLIEPGTIAESTSPGEIITEIIPTYYNQFIAIGPSKIYWHDIALIDGSWVITEKHVINRSPVGDGTNNMRRSAYGNYHLLIPVGNVIDTYKLTSSPNNIGYQYRWSNNTQGTITKVVTLDDNLAVYITDSSVVPYQYRVGTTAPIPVIANPAVGGAIITDIDKVDNRHVVVSMSDGAIKVLEITASPSYLPVSVTSVINITGDPCNSITSINSRSIFDATNNTWYSIDLTDHTFLAYGGIGETNLGPVVHSGTSLYFPSTNKMFDASDRYLIDKPSGVLQSGKAGEWSIDLTEDPYLSITATVYPKRSRYTASNTRLNRGHNLAINTAWLGSHEITNIKMAQSTGQVFVQFNTNTLIIYGADMTTLVLSAESIAEAWPLTSTASQTTYASVSGTIDGSGNIVRGDSVVIRTTGATVGTVREVVKVGYYPVKVVGVDADEFLVLWKSNATGNLTTEIYYPGGNSTYFTDKASGDIGYTGEVYVVSNNDQIEVIDFDNIGSPTIITPSISNAKVSTSGDITVIISDSIMFLYRITNVGFSLITVMGTEGVVDAWVDGDTVIVVFDKHIEEYSIFTGKPVPLGIIPNTGSITACMAHGDFRMLLYDSNAALGLYTLDDADGVATDSVLIDVRADGLSDIRRIDLIGSTYLVDMDPFWSLELDPPINVSDAVITNFKIETKWERA